MNWFTYTPIQYLSDEPGWSGNIQTSGGSGGNCVYGMGSGNWVFAKHNMGLLAGAGNVMFRFYFGAGTQCNDFDGFAIDDIHIDETPPPNVANFSYTCGLNGEVQFTNNSSACSVQWDFGDPASGSNTSSQVNPVHTFSVPGQSYTVTLTANFPSGPAYKTITIYTLAATPVITSYNQCYGDSNVGLAVNNVSGEKTVVYLYS